jgi:hypothetical protein
MAGMLLQVQPLFFPLLKSVCFDTALKRHLHREVWRMPGAPFVLPL